jgi:adhesin transport system outer membrane protein
MRDFRVWLLGTVCGLALVTATNANAMTLQQAVEIAVDSNPEIGQAIEDRTATAFELQQALGLYAPRVDLQGSTGVDLLSNPSRRAAGIDGNPLYPTEVGISVSYDIFDSGYRDAESDRQSARVDGASLRVLERSEFIALQIAQQYFEVMLQARIRDIARQNVTFHDQTLRNVTDLQGKTSTEADLLQAKERLAAAKARVVEAQEALDAAKSSFQALVGLPFDKGAVPPRVGHSLPATLDQAMGEARSNNPRLRLASADIDAASFQVDESKAGLGPKLTFQGDASAGNDIGGTEGLTADLSGKLVFKMNLFDGGIKQAEVQENIHRETQTMMAQQQALREVEDQVRVSWDRIRSQSSLAGQYQQQLNASDSLVSAYSDQFTVGSRSLLDVLDAQNSKFSVQILAETANFGVRFSEYRLMAASGKLLAFLGVAPPDEAVADMRTKIGASSAADAEPRLRQPLRLDGPIDLTHYTK